MYQHGWGLRRLFSTSRTRNRAHGFYKATTDIQWCSLIYSLPHATLLQHHISPHIYTFCAIHDKHFYYFKMLRTISNATTECWFGLSWKYTSTSRPALNSAAVGLSDKLASQLLQQITMLWQLSNYAFLSCQYCLLCMCYLTSVPWQINDDDYNL